MNTKLNKQRITTMLIASVLITSMPIMSGTQAFAHTLITNVSLEYDNFNPVEGEAVLMTANVTTSDTPGKGGSPSHTAVIVNDGKGSIEQGFYQAPDLTILPVPVSDCTLANTWIKVSDYTTPVDGIFTYTLDTTGLGGQTLVYRAHYVPPGGPNEGLPGQANGICTPLTIETLAGLCAGDLEISATFTESSNPNFGYNINVLACKDIENLKIQGGNNAWSKLNSVVAENGFITTKTLKKNLVWTDTLAFLGEGEDENIDVSISGQVECGKTVGINGAWSVVYDIVGGAKGIKSSYTEPLTYTAPPCS